METTCTASDACTEAGKSRRATAVGVDDVEDEERLLGDGDDVGGAAAGERSLTNLPADAEPKALLAVSCCWCWCSGVVGSDDTPGLLDGSLRILLSGVCITDSLNSQLSIS